MLIELRDSQGNVLDAKVEVHPDEIVIHSRGGAYGKPNLRNPDHRKAVRRVLECIVANGWGISGVWLDSRVAQAWPLDERLVLKPDELGAGIDQAITLIGQRGAAKGRKEGSSGHGNSTKRIKIGLQAAQVSQILSLLQTTPALPSGRLPAAILRQVTDTDIDAAVVMYTAGAPHKFGPSSDYDLVLPNGTLAAPKAIFGLALGQHLGRLATPDDFSGGRGTICFELLEAAGYPIIEKGAEPTEEPPTDLPPDEEASWAEGAKSRATHLRRERAKGLSAAKKRNFISKHGHLFCERCLLVPSETLGAFGDACIEVHHAATTVAMMGDDHVTRLQDLQCLCANCHRIVHRGG